jgi:hypothetical protein
MTRRSSDTARRAGLIAVAVALAAALAAARARLADRASGGTLATLPRDRDRARAIRGRFRRSAEQTYTCQCGTTYRVSGTDRHRVYWPAPAAEDAPVLGERCVECDAPLPGGRATRPA